MAAKLLGGGGSEETVPTLSRTARRGESYDDVNCCVRRGELLPRCCRAAALRGVSGGRVSVIAPTIRS